MDIEPEQATIIENLKSQLRQKDEEAAEAKKEFAKFQEICLEVGDKYMTLVKHADNAYETSPYILQLKQDNSEFNRQLREANSKVAELERGLRKETRAKILLQADLDRLTQQKASLKQKYDDLEEKYNEAVIQRINARKILFKVWGQLAPGQEIPSDLGRIIHQAGDVRRMLWEADQDRQVAENRLRELGQQVSTLKAARGRAEARYEDVMDMMRKRKDAAILSAIDNFEKAFREAREWMDRSRTYYLAHPAEWSSTTMNSIDKAVQEKGEDFIKNLRSAIGALGTGLEYRKGRLARAEAAEKRLKAELDTALENLAGANEQVTALKVANASLEEAKAREDEGITVAFFSHLEQLPGTAE